MSQQVDRAEPGWLSDWAAEIMTPDFLAAEGRRRVDSGSLQLNVRASPRRDRWMAVLAASSGSGVIRAGTNKPGSSRTGKAARTGLLGRCRTTDPGGRSVVRSDGNHPGTEREGFEPSTEVASCNSLAGSRFQPLSHLSSGPKSLPDHPAHLGQPAWALGLDRSLRPQSPRKIRCTRRLSTFTSRS